MEQTFFELNTVTVGPLQTNCYVILSRNKQAIIIDPGFESEKILEVCGQAKVTHILLTHAHFDHVGAVDIIRKKTGCKVLLHAKDRELYGRTHNMALLYGMEAEPLDPPDILLNSEGQVLDLPLSAHFLETPGHTAGGVCYVLDDLLLSGDTLFAGSIGRTDFPESSSTDMRRSLEKLISLNDDFKVFPGHGPSTTLEHERQSNPFLLELV